jgi:hypothetical protein
MRLKVSKEQKLNSKSTSEMRWKVDALHSTVAELLKESGFPEDHYVIRKGSDYVSVMFDLKEAVDYFRGDFDTSVLAEDCVYEYKQDGKRHCAYIYSW